MLAATVGALLGLEIGFRLYAAHQIRRVTSTPALPIVQVALQAHRPATAPELAYEFGPNLSFPGLPHFTNAAGLRGPGRSLQKPSRTVRIAGLGDSMMAADLYPAEQSFLFVVERMLNDAATSGVRFEALNFAVSAYNTQDEEIVLRRKALAYDPDWVVLAIVCDDCARPAYYRMQDAKGQARIVNRVGLEMLEPFSTGLAPDDRPWWAASMLARWIHHRSFLKRDQHEGAERFRRAFRQIAKTCRRHDIRLLAVSLTEHVDVGREDLRAVWHALVRQTADEAGVPLLEMYPAILAHLKAKGLASYSRYWTSELDQHPNPEGHRLLAEIVFPKLKAMGILETPPERTN